MYRVVRPNPVGSEPSKPSLYPSPRGASPAFVCTDEEPPPPIATPSTPSPWSVPCIIRSRVYIQLGHAQYSLVGVSSIRLTIGPKQEDGNGNKEGARNGLLSIPSLLSTVRLFQLTTTLPFLFRFAHANDPCRRRWQEVAKGRRKGFGRDGWVGGRGNEIKGGERWFSR